MKKLDEHQLVHNGRNVYALYVATSGNHAGKEPLISLKAFWFTKSNTGTLMAHEGILFEPADTFKGKNWDAIASGMVHPAYPVYTWDGTTMTSYMNQSLKDSAQERLQEALDNYPAIPRGYQGWYDMEIDEIVVEDMEDD